MNSTTVLPPKDGLYNNIWNIVNPNDIITKFPLAQWGFTRFGTDLFIPTQFFDPENYAENRHTVECLFSEHRGPYEYWQEYIADDFTMYQLPSVWNLSNLSLSDTYLEMLRSLCTVDDTKRNYDANIVSTILLEEVAEGVGTRSDYCDNFQEIIRDLLLTHIVDTEGNSSASASFTEILWELPSVIKEMVFDRPNEVVSLIINVMEIIQNHYEFATLAHVKAQDPYYIDAWNSSHSEEIKLVPLRGNADLARASLFGYNGLSLDLDGQNAVLVEG